MHLCQETSFYTLKHFVQRILDACVKLHVISEMNSYCCTTGQPQESCDRLKIASETIMARTLGNANLFKFQTTKLLWSTDTQ